MNDIINIGGVDCYEKDGTAYLKLETVARGLGFTQQKNGTEYVKWERVSGYLDELGFSPQVGKDGFIPENIFYRLAMKAKNEAAEKFQAKIADEVIPSIRKHGAYITSETVDRMIESPEFGIKLLTALKEEQAKRRELEQQAAEDAPKVLFADSVSASNTSILVFDLAKLLRQNGVDIGGNRLFAWMRENGYLVRRKGADYNMPTQKSMEMGLFEVKETVITHSDGHVTTNKTPKVTGKGQVYFINKFLASGGREGR
ncbi:MAG TPA: phage antirepressor KilAC domain-containing protein [Candidatus Agathobaculum pullistercoris]|nr:phage antirepressor KilAC domain-containing protein [uncultured Agathobaculum sp.]HIX11864.1 phage antirepressor KilAC domain-containing protein [Candidatus Agathobaculum pullistercoris]